MKPGKKVTFKQTTSAAISVQRELYEIGLWNENSKLFSTEIIWGPLSTLVAPDAHGFFFHGTKRIHRVFGFEEGHIYIPQWVLYQGLWQNRGSLRDIIRHEYGHAFAHHYPELIIDSVQFEKVFGSNYFDCNPVEMNRNAFISDYAQSMPMEDFAETFRVYVRRKSVLFDNIKNKKLIAKWKFIRKVINQI